MIIDPFTWLAYHPWFLVGVLLATIGLGMEYVFRAYRDKHRPEPYKPKPYRVTVEADDGWPMRSYSLPREAAARLVNQLDRERDLDKPE